MELSDDLEQHQLIMPAFSRSIVPVRGVVARAAFIRARGIASTAVVRSEPKEESKGLISVSLPIGSGLLGLSADETVAVAWFFKSSS